MGTITVPCPRCAQTAKIVRMGHAATGKPRCKCQACGKTFQTQYVQKTRQPGVKAQILAMGINGPGIGREPKHGHGDNKKKPAASALFIRLTPEKPANQAAKGSD